METTYNFENEEMICELENEKEKYEREFEQLDEKYKNSTNILIYRAIDQIINENINEIIDHQNNKKYIINLILNKIKYIINFNY